MRFTTNLEWTKIRKLIVILLLSILLAYITIRLVLMNDEMNEPQEKIEVETNKSFC
jgi:type II secretory pathway pseudopilin PulG